MYEQIIKNDARFSRYDESDHLAASVEYLRRGGKDSDPLVTAYKEREMRLADLLAWKMNRAGIDVDADKIEMELKH